MGQLNSRSKGQHPYPPYPPPPPGYYAPPYPSYGQFGAAQPFNQHTVVPYPYMPQPQRSTRRKKKRRPGTVMASHSRRRNPEPPGAGSARFAEALDPSSHTIRRAQTPFHRPTHLEDGEDEEEQEDLHRDGDGPVVPEGSGSYRTPRIRTGSGLPPPPEIKMFTPRPPNPLPLPPRDIFESPEYKAAMRGPIGTSAILAAMYPPKEERDDNLQRSRTGLFGKRSSKGGLFRSLTGTRKKKDEGPDIAMGSGIRLLPIPVGAADYNKISTPTASAAPTTNSVEPPFPHPPPGVATSAQRQQPVIPFLVAGADPNAAPPAPAPVPVQAPAPDPSQTPLASGDSSQPLYFNQTHPDYGGFLPHSHHRIEHEGHVYKSATHLHEALKYPDHPHIAEAIRTCNSLSDIFHIATSNADRARQDWPLKFVEIMEWVMMLKFSQHPNLRALLLLTNNRHLVYAEERDSFWGDGVGLDAEGNRKPLAPGQPEGANELGQMLMRIRDRIRTQSPDPYQQQ
ncbi:hypothetical protein VKT23_003451 [Stygiomarasmius scandens]|uniref:NADAR domain-containing protein n=1 Tax=Marasmiellus scandens TaxID=2682957 RepID=A0ABR1JZK1_9AGAR